MRSGKTGLAEKEFRFDWATIKFSGGAASVVRHGSLLCETNVDELQNVLCTLRGFGMVTRV